jgi:hypothetical protein
MQALQPLFPVLRFFLYITFTVVAFHGHLLGDLMNMEARGKEGVE